MPPIREEDPLALIKRLIEENDIMVFSTTTCPWCTLIKQFFNFNGVSYHALDIDMMSNSIEVRTALAGLTTRTSVPQVYIKQEHVGGYDDTMATVSSGDLSKTLDKQIKTYDYDLIVIGGGSGGLAASKAAASFGKKVAVLDFVAPTPLGTSWGLGGTCVNVGCIPKKLMHTSSIVGETIRHGVSYGWNIPELPSHSWDMMRDNVVNYIKSLNWNYKVALKDNRVHYINGSGKFVGPNKIVSTDKKGKQTFLTAERFLISTGERPRYPIIPGAKEYCITSDDLFHLKYPPGKTLVIGASYVALECAGFLKGIGYDVTLMVRSIYLRGFDQEMASKIGDFMEKEGIKILRPCVPIKVEQVEAGTPGRLKVWYQKSGTDEVHFEIFNTVLLAIGRDPCTNNIGLEKVGVELNKDGRVIVNKKEQTTVPYIYAIGDIIQGGLQLTPVAIQAGTLLAKRLYNNRSELCDYINVATTVFTPLEYGCIGYSEEVARDTFGDVNIEVYHQSFQPLEWTIPDAHKNTCYAKLICLKNDSERVVGFHYLGPNAGEVTQGYAIAMKLGATKEHFDSTIGIHPTNSEIFTTLSITKSSGKSSEATGC